MSLSLFCEQIDDHHAQAHRVQLFVLRLDLIHPLVSGNKWFKLKYNLQAAITQNYSQNHPQNYHDQTNHDNNPDNLISLDLDYPSPQLLTTPKILTFGGAYSNHIYATAAAGKLFNIPTIGIIRAAENFPLNPTLQFAQDQGMQLVYVTRANYQLKNTTSFQTELRTQFGNVYIIPEGGCNLNGVRGCTEILTELDNFDVICVACGTATTLAGIALSLHKNQRVIGFPVLKGGEYLNTEITNLVNQYLASNLPLPGDRSLNWQLNCHYHFGGYAKINPQLLLFKQTFEKDHGIILDYIYTAKMFYGVIDLIQQGYFRNNRVLLIHTGGIQGNQGIEQRIKPV